MNNLNSLFPSNSAGPTTDYPYGSARNITTSGDNTGTPFEASLQNDIIGLQQFLLQEAGIVPDGSPDNATNSQQFDAIWEILNMRTVTHNFTTDSDYTLSDEENLRLRFEIIDLSPVLTATRAVIVNDIQKRFLVQNDTLQTLTFKTAAGTGVDVVAGQSADLYCDGVNVITCVDASTLEISSTAQALDETENTTVLSPLRLREAFNASGSAPIFACRAWVNFGSVTTTVIKASGNVSSITDGGTGNHTMNLIVGIEDADYSYSGGANYNTTSTVGGVSRNSTDIKTTTQFQFHSTNTGSGTVVDTTDVAMNLFR